MINKIKFSHLFSYWCLVWFIMYYLYYIVFNNNNKIRIIVNPIPVFMFALIENIIMLMIMIVSYKPISSIILYLFVILFMKLIPLYLLRNQPILWVKSILFTSLVFFIYNLYLIYNQTSLYEIYKKTMISLLEEKHDTPGYNLIYKMYLQMLNIKHYYCI
jgi:hypothetical protein